MGDGSRDRTYDRKRTPAKAGAPDRPQARFVDFEELAEQLSVTLDEIEDGLSQRFQINIPTRLQIDCNVGDETVLGTLIWKKVGTPALMRIFIEFTQSKTGVIQHEHVSRSPGHWRCAAVKALPQLMTAIEQEQTAARERMQDAVQSATAFLESLR